MTHYNISRSRLSACRYYALRRSAKTCQPRTGFRLPPTVCRPSFLGPLAAYNHAKAIRVLAALFMGTHVRNGETIDSELQLIAVVRRSIREHAVEPPSRAGPPARRPPRG